MADTDPIMDKIRKDQRRMAWRIWPALACLVVLIGAVSIAVGWQLGASLQRPTIVQIDGPLHVLVSYEAKP